MYSFLLVGAGYLIASVQAQGYYILQDSFLGGPAFLDNFNFWTSWDPTYGYVHYVNQTVAEQYNMINITDSTVAWGVDTSQTLDPDANLGRLSIRLTSVQTYTHGLFVLDLVHMPDSACGSWPSFWSLGGTGTWPNSGEIDVIESVNHATTNLMSLHSEPGCTVAGVDETGTLLADDCGAAGGFEGCTVQSTTPSSFGANFNAIGGGVYALEWTSTAIKIWFFPRYAIPATLSTPFPDTSTFGVPMANFEGSCNIDTYFFNHSLIFDVDFCGSWAGPTFQTDGCPALDPSDSWSSCNEYVALNPSAFQETYWEVNYLNIYSLVPGTAPTTSSVLSSVTPAVSTSAVNSALGGAQGRSSTPTMSLAGSTPTITTGTFTATSSVLSVLSSLSASSVSASAVSASLAGSATTPGAPGTSVIASGLGTPASVASSAVPTTAPTSTPTASSPSNGLSSSASGTPASSHSSTLLTSAASSPGASVPTISASAPSPILTIPPSLPPVSTSPDIAPCTGPTCTSFVTVVVVETVVIDVTDYVLPATTTTGAGAGAGHLSLAPRSIGQISLGSGLLSGLTPSSLPTVSESSRVLNATHATSDAGVRSGSASRLRVSTSAAELGGLLLSAVTALVAAVVL